MNEKENERMVGVTLPESLIKTIQDQAQREMRSMSAQIKFILKEHFEEKE